MEIYPNAKLVQPVQLERSDISAARPDARQTTVVRQPEPIRQESEPSAQQAKPEEVARAVDAVNEQLALQQRKVQLSLDENLEQPVISVIDVETDEVIRQLPSEQVLKLAKFRAENPPFPEPDTSAQFFDDIA